MPDGRVTTVAAGALWLLEGSACDRRLGASLARIGRFGAATLASLKRIKELVTKSESART